MSGDATHEKIVRLLTTFDNKIEAVPDDLKCEKCKSVLQDAGQVSCGCRFCRTCVDDLVARGFRFCPGSSQECVGTHLSTAHRDYRANMSVSKLIVKCPLTGCLHECPLVDMEDHLQVCQRKRVDSLFHEPGGPQEMKGQLQWKNHSCIEVLIGMVANMSKDMENVKSELVLKDEQIKTITDEMRHLQNENKLIKDENKSIKDENELIKDQFESIKRDKEVLSDRVGQLSEKLDMEIGNRLEDGEMNSVRVTTIIGTTRSNRNALRTELESVKGDIRSISEDNGQSIKSDIDPMKWQVQSARTATGLGRVDASCDEWLINIDVGKTNWGSSWTSLFGVFKSYEGPKTSDTFRGVVRPYTYQLASWNRVSSGVLGIRLRILAGNSDSLMEWPFRGTVTVTVAHRDRREACTRQMQQCQIERPLHNQYSGSNIFRFPHAALRGAGMNLERGVCVSCQVMPSAGQ